MRWIVAFLIGLLIYFDISGDVKSTGSAVHLSSGREPCLTTAEKASIRKAIGENIQILKSKGLLNVVNTSKEPITFQWPLKYYGKDYGYGFHCDYVDHDPLYDSVQDYNCGDRTYDFPPGDLFPDGYNHTGTDIALWPFMWHKMAKKEVAVVAGAAGTIVYKEGSHYDLECEPLL